MRKCHKKFLKHPGLAQAASELAIFGAVLLFVIGLIIKTGLYESQKANTQLSADRRALTESYKTSEGAYTTAAFSSARNSASILLVEDRLSVDPSDKMGTRDRTPLMAQGTGTMSRTLFMDFRWDDTDDIPVFDVFVNGQRFPFSSSALREITFADKNGNKANWLPDCSKPGGPNIKPFPGNGEYPYGVCWEPNCVSMPSGDVQGCPVFFKVVGNYNSNTEWCDGTFACKTAESVWSLNERFDYDFDGTTNIKDTDVAYDLPGIGEVKSREIAAWQWLKVAGVAFGRKHNLGEGIEGMRFAYKEEGCRNCSVDVDGDFKEENLMKTPDFVSNTGVIRKLYVMDTQEGDYDGSIDEWPEKIYEAKFGKPFPQQGFSSSDLKMYSFTHDGTAFRVEEGKLFDPIDGQFIRTTTAQDHIDIIERVFVLNKDTGRFCNGNIPRDWATDPPAGCKNMPNPVEACGNCFSPANLERTCLDFGESALGDPPKIYMRSRLPDDRQKRAITRILD